MYRVTAPDYENPEATGFPVEVGENRTLESALERARAYARDTVGRPRAIVQIEETGTPNVWTVQYHPEDPLPTGGVDPRTGIPEYRFPVEFRVVYDGQEVEIVDPDTNETGELVGPKQVDDEEPK